MILRVINFIILILLNNSLLNAEGIRLNSVLKYYTFQEVVIDLQKYSGKTISLNIYKCRRVNLKQIILNHNINKNNINHSPVYKFEGMITNNNLRLYGIGIGVYLIEIKNNKIKEYSGLIITKNRLIYKQYNDNILLWAVDTKDGEPLKKFKILFNGNKIKQIKDYTYELKLYNIKNSIILNDKKSPDYIYVEPIKSESENRFLIKILPKKIHYLLKENLEFSVILREDIGSRNYQAPVSSDIKIIIFDKKNNVIFKKIVSGIRNGIYKFSQILDDRFNNGKYRVVVSWQNSKDEFYFIILNRYSDFHIFKINSNKEVYFHNQLIKINAKIYNRDGSYADYGMLRYEIWAKKIDENNYKLYRVIKRYCKNGKSKIEFYPNFLSKNHNYDIKIILKYRSNNGIIEGDYIKFRIIKSDFKIEFNSDKNIYEVNQPVYINYKITRLNLDSKIDKSELVIYRFKSLNKKGEVITAIRKKVKVNRAGKIKVILNRTGFYKAVLKLKSTTGNVTFGVTYFYIISYTYGLKETKSVKNILIIPDKNEYDYSDIGKVFIMLPYNNLWIYITIEREKVYSFSSFLVEKNYMIYDFPIYEKYSPNVFLNVTFIHKGKIISRKIKLNVPLITKRMKIKVKQEMPVSTSENTNKISILTYNAWGHKITSDMIVNTINKNYMELYNFKFFNLYRYIYPEKRDAVITMNETNIKNNSIKNDISMNKPFNEWDYVNTPYIDDASIYYKLIYIPEEETNIKLAYPCEENSWITYFYGLTSDTKIGRIHIEHQVEKPDEVKYFIPKFLNVNDEVYLDAIIFNHKTFPVKMKFSFNIVNGKFISKFLRKIETFPEQFNKFSLLLHLKDARTTKIHIDRVSPFTKKSNEFFIPVAKHKTIPKIKNRFLRVKKKYYWLKYYENSGVYYSKMKSTFFWWGRLHKNKEIMVVIELNSKKSYRDLQVNDFLPSGCKFIPIENYKYRITDIKPDLNYSITTELDRINIHIPYLPKGKKHIYYIIKPYLIGSFYIPGIYVENNEKVIYSDGKRKRIKIVE